MRSRSVRGPHSGTGGTEGGVGMGPSLEGGAGGTCTGSGRGCWGPVPFWLGMLGHVPWFWEDVPRFGWCAGGCTLSWERLLGAQLCTDYCVGQECPSASAGGRTRRAGAGGAGRRRSSCLGHILGAWRGASNLLGPQWRRLEELSVAGRAHVEGHVCDSEAGRGVCSRRPVRGGCGLSAEVRACRWAGRCAGRIIAFCPVQGASVCKAGRTCTVRQPLSGGQSGDWL